MKKSGRGRGTGKEKRHNAPPLEHGERVKLYGRLPDYAKEGLRDIAAEENRSMAWVVEEVIIRYFGLKRPRYKARKRR